MSLNRNTLYRFGVVMLAALVLMILVQPPQASQAAPQAAGAPMVGAQVFDVSCTSIPAVTTTYAKLADLATFTVQAPGSLVELTYNGRIYVGTFTGSTGAVFELRVDGAASTVGRARATLRTEDVGGGGVQASIIGLFSGLSAGSHTASIWVRTFYGSGTQAVVDPGCWSSDVLIVKEYTPFGIQYLPSVTR